MRRTERGIHPLLFIALTVAAIHGAQGANRTRIWIDTDPAIGAPWREVDDAFALVLAFHSPEVEIAGVSTTYGNAGLTRTTAVARDLVRRFGAPADLHSSDVYPGASSARALQARTAATEALAVALRRGSLTYVALGPLTNLATFFRFHPELAGRIERIIFLGGRSPGRAPAFGPRHSFRVHDANVFKDPVSAEAVMRSAVPITLTPLELAPQLALSRSDMEQLRGGGPPGDFLYRNTRAWLWFWTSVVREPGGLVFDAIPVLAAVRPEFLRTERRSVQLCGNGDLVVGASPRRGSRAVRFSSGVRSDAKPFLVRRLQRHVYNSG